MFYQFEGDLFRIFPSRFLYCYVVFSIDCLTSVEPACKSVSHDCAGPTWETNILTVESTYLVVEQLLIIYECEAQQWATYLRSLFTGSLSEASICSYDIATVSSRQDDFLRLSQYSCKLLILSKGMLEGLCPKRRFFLARVLCPATAVVVLLCGVESLAPLLEQVPLNGDDCLQVSSEQDAHEYLSAVTDIVKKGRAMALKSFWLFLAVRGDTTGLHFN